MFKRGAEPLPENLSDLSDLVIRENCDIGLAVDPDSDRLAIIDEHGKPLGEEYTLVLAAAGYLSQKLQNHLILLIQGPHMLMILSLILALGLFLLGFLVLRSQNRF